MPAIPPYSSEKVSSDFLVVNSCGGQWLSGQDSENLRPHGRVDYAIQYISQGMGYYEEGGVTRPVPPGSLILYFPSVPQHYSFKKENKTFLLWTHFTGTACEMLSPLQSQQAVILPIGPVHEFEQFFQGLIHSHFTRESDQGAASRGYLLLLLSLMLKSAQRSPKGEGRDHEGLDQVMNHMQQHFREPIDLSAYAAMCFVSRDRFLHLFKERFGLSPYHFQLAIRLDRAAEMLSNTPISVSACAEAVGFRDGSYFCRIFKKYKGCTPLSLQKRYK